MDPTLRPDLARQGDLAAQLDVVIALFVEVQEDPSGQRVILVSFLSEVRRYMPDGGLVGLDTPTGGRALGIPSPRGVQGGKSYEPQSPLKVVDR